MLNNSRALIISFHQFERDQLEKQLVETKRESARTIRDLSKEISELEALVESKIYREDELERELELAREKLARQKTSSTDSTNVMLDTKMTHVQANCEICEQPGHDIVNCDLLQKDPSSTFFDRNSLPSTEMFCEDCESHGHLPAHCPHSMNVF